MKRNVPEGAKVKFTHTRVGTGRTNYLSRSPSGWTETPEPTGGFTECRLILEDGTEIVGEARCCELDNYSKKVGRDISLGRALKRAETKFPELFAKEKVA